MNLNKCSRSRLCAGLNIANIVFKRRKYYIKYAISVNKYNISLNNLHLEMDENNSLTISRQNSSCLPPNLTKINFN